MRRIRTLTAADYKRLYSDEKDYILAADPDFHSLEARLFVLHEEYEHRVIATLGAFIRYFLNDTMLVTRGGEAYSRGRVSNLTNMRLLDEALPIVTFPNPKSVRVVDDLMYDIELLVSEMLLEEQAVIHAVSLSEMEKEELRVALILRGFGQIAFNGLSDKQRNAIIESGTGGVSLRERFWGEGMHRDWLTKELGKIAKRLKNDLTNILEVERDIRKTFSTNRARVINVGLSEMSRVQSGVRGELYRANRVEKYRFVSEHDAKTCVDCSALDGMEFLVSEREEGVNAPLMHSRCRCRDYPVEVYEEE